MTASADAHDRGGKSITGAAAVMGTSILLSRVLGLVRTRVLAGYGGTGFEVDAYVAAFLIPDYLNHFMASGFLSITFIPIIQRYLSTGNRDEAWRCFSNLFTVGTVVLAVLLALGVVYADELLFAIERLKGLFGAAPGLRRDPQWVALTVRLTRIVMPAQLFLYWGSFLMAVQFAHRRFLFPALQPLFYNAGIIAGGVLGSRIPSLGIEGFAWGVLGGAFVGAVVVQVPGARAAGLRFRPRFHLNDTDLRSFVVLSLPFVVGIGMTYSIELFRLFGLFLSEGAMSSLNYSVRTMMILVAVLGQGVATASYPFMSRLSAEGKLQEMNRLAVTIIKRISILVIPVSCVLFVLAPDILGVLFQHGKFGHEATSFTAPLLSIYLVGAFAFTANTVVMRCFYAVQNTFEPMVISTVSVAASVPLYFVAMRSLGATGVPLVLSATVICQFLVLLARWSLRHGSLKILKEVLATQGVLWAFGIPGALACRGLRYALITHSPLPETSFVFHLAALPLAGIPALAAIYFAAYLAGLREIGETLGQAARRLSPGR